MVSVLYQLNAAKNNQINDLVPYSLIYADDTKEENEEKHLVQSHPFHKSDDVVCGLSRCVKCHHSITSSGSIQFCSTSFPDPEMSLGKQWKMARAPACLSACVGEKDGIRDPWFQPCLTRAVVGIWSTHHKEKDFLSLCFSNNFKESWALDLDLDLHLDFPLLKLAH